MQKVKILCDTGALQSLLLEGALPFEEPHKDIVLIKGIGGCKGVPLHEVYLNSDLVKGKVTVGVMPDLPVKGVSLILGNDLAGSMVLTPEPDKTPGNGDVMDYNHNEHYSDMCHESFTSLPTIGTENIIKTLWILSMYTLLGCLMNIIGLFVVHTTSMLTTCIIAVLPHYIIGVLETYELLTGMSSCGLVVLVYIVMNAESFSLRFKTFISSGESVT